MSAARSSPARRRCAAARTLLALLAAAPLAAQERATVVIGARLVIAPRTFLEGDAARLLIRNGSVAGVGTEVPREALDAAHVLRFDGATIVPGFVVAHDLLASAQDLGETITAATPALAAADAFDPYDKELARFARGGVTAVGLAPSSANTLGGLGAVVRWRDGGGEVLEPQTYVKAALVAAALDQERYPTSRMGASDLLRSSFRAARTPRDRDARVLAEVLAGGRRLAIHAATAAEIGQALDLCAELGVRPILLGADDAAQCLPRLRGAGASLALAPLDLDSGAERLALPGALERDGVEFSFLGADPERLRLSAALAVRHGLSRATALAALTRVPAAQLGVESKVGSLRRDCSADLAVFDGDPLDLSSRLLAVFIAGTRITEEDAAK